MIRYSTNWMGPINSEWIKENGRHWAAGRIDIYGPWPFPDEYGLRMMHYEDWNSFSEWLGNLKTKRKWGFDRIIKEYEKTHSKIRWFKDE